MSDSSRPHLSSFTLDTLVLGALPADESALARAHIAACRECGAEMEARTAAGEHFRQHLLSRRLLASRDLARRRFWPRFAPVIPAAAAAALVLLAILPRDQPAPATGVTTAEPADLAVKGATITFRMYASRGGEVIAVRDGITLAASDRIRFAVSSATHRYVLIASVDGSGAATIYHPYGGARSESIQTGRSIELPGSIVLDHAPGPERVYALFSTQPIPAARVLASLREVGAGGAAAIRSTDSLDVGAGEQSSILIEKASR